MHTILLFIARLTILRKPVHYSSKDDEAVFSVHLYKYVQLYPITEILVRASALTSSNPPPWLEMEGNPALSLLPPPAFSVMAQGGLKRDLGGMGRPQLLGLSTDPEDLFSSHYLERRLYLTRIAEDVIIISSEKLDSDRASMKFIYIYFLVGVGIMFLGSEKLDKRNFF